MNVKCVCSLILDKYENESKSWWHVFLSWQIMALCMFFSNIPVSYAQSPDK